MYRRIITIFTLIVILVIAGVVYYRYYFVFGDGTKAGTMNYFVHKGYMSKTYEGRLIQSGIRTTTPGTTQSSIQSNEFKFSVTNPGIAEELNRNAGSFVELHYKEYLHTLPWRGVSVFVVDRILTVRPSPVPQSY